MKPLYIFLHSSYSYSCHQPPPLTMTILVFLRSERSERRKLSQEEHKQSHNKKNAFWENTSNHAQDENMHGGTPVSQPPGGRLCIGPSTHPNTHKFLFPQFPPIVRFGNILLGVGGVKYFLTV